MARCPPRLLLPWAFSLCGLASPRDQATTFKPSNSSSARRFHFNKLGDFSFLEEGDGYKVRRAWSGTVQLAAEQYHSAWWGVKGLLLAACCLSGRTF